MLQRPEKSTLKQSTQAEQFLTNCRSALFGALLALCRDAQSYNSVSIIFIALEFIQVLSFVLSPHASLPWTTGKQWATKPLSSFLQYFSLSEFDLRASSVSDYIDMYPRCFGCV